MVNRDGTNSLPGPQYRVGLNSAQPLPRCGLRYQITPQSQIFASVSTNFRSATEYVLYTTYDVVGDQLTKGAAQRDEYSISEELGYRYQGRLLDGSVTLFNYNFTNRQVSTLIDGVIGSSINAGGQTSRGVDAETRRAAGTALAALRVGGIPARHDRQRFRHGWRLSAHRRQDGRAQPRRARLPSGVDYDDGGTYFANACRQIRRLANIATFNDDERMAGPRAGGRDAGPAACRIARFVQQAGGAAELHQPDGREVPVRRGGGGAECA